MIINLHFTFILYTCMVFITFLLIFMQYCIVFIYATLFIAIVSSFDQDSQCRGRLVQSIDRTK